MVSYSFSRALFLAVPVLLASACGVPEPDDSGDVNTKTYIGTYEFNGGSHSFQLCGSALVLPLIPGDALDKLTDLYRKNNGPVVLEVAAHVVTAPASEGEGNDDYLEVDRLVGKAKCP